MSATSTTSNSFKSRNVARSFPAIEQSEGAGARVRRSIGTAQARNFSPFLMLDHFFVGKGAGFPDHPHRGQETVTYMLKGFVDHEDFTGSAGTIGPGDLQFMTAGKGIVHAEMPRTDDAAEPAEGMQLWVDLPANLKACEPRYRDLMAAEIPVAKPNDKVEIKVISGTAFGVQSVQDLAYTPVWYFHYKISPGGTADQEIPEDFNSFLYVLKGSVEVGDSIKRTIPQFSIAMFDRNGTGVTLSVPETAKEPAEFVLIGGQVLNQPIVQHGPFVETSREKIMQAFMDYQGGENGFERRIGWESEIGKRND